MLAYFFNYIHQFSIYFFFFFQAEDGIRDLTVTGVQTCALPIFVRPLVAQLVTGIEPAELDLPPLARNDAEALARHFLRPSLEHLAERLVEIGRASCRERG